MDVVQILTEQPTTRKASTYWSVLKKRLKEEGADELLTNCKQLKLPAADKFPITCCQQKRQKLFRGRIKKDGAIFDRDLTKMITEL